MTDYLPAPVEAKRARTGPAWLTITARTFAVAALTGAGQLGAAQALAILVWSPAPAAEVWRRQLSWLVFIFAASVLVGVAGGNSGVRAVRHAIAAARAEARARRKQGAAPGAASPRPARAPVRGWTVDVARGLLAAMSRVSAILFASLGALASFLLVWLPTRETLDPSAQQMLMTAAGTGIAVGAFVSLLSFAAAPIATNAAIWLGGVWTFGIASVATAMAVGVPPSAPLLGFLDAPHLFGPNDWWAGPSVIVVVAVLVSGAVAAFARRVHEHGLAVALSGLAGPSMVVAGYQVAGPSGDLRLSSAVALLAAGAGLLTSVAIALPRSRRTATPTPVPVPVAPPPEPAAIEAAPALVTGDEATAVTIAPTTFTVDAPVLAPAPAVTPVDVPGRPVAEHHEPASVPVAAALSRTDEDGPRRARRRDRDTRRMGKSEREHVAWVTHLTSIPPDPTLLTRQR